MASKHQEGCLSEPSDLSDCTLDQTYSSGCEVISDGEPEGELEKRYFRCKKNPDHKSFIPVKEFSMEHLPEGLRNLETMDMIKRKIDLTVAIRVTYTSAKRPDMFHDCNDKYPDANHKGQFGFVRYGTGCIISMAKFEGKCPCHLCRDSGDRKIEYWKIDVSTATHVIFDDLEAKHAQFKCFYDSDDREGMKILYGIGLDGFYDPDELYETDFNRRVMCVTHDKETAERLSGEFGTIMTLDVSNFIQPSPALMISHPHGSSKRITMGNLLHLTVPIKYKPLIMKKYTVCHVPPKKSKEKVVGSVSKEEMSMEDAIDDMLKTAVMAVASDSGNKMSDRVEHISDNIHILKVGDTGGGQHFFHDILNTSSVFAPSASEEKTADGLDNATSQSAMIPSELENQKQIGCEENLDIQRQLLSSGSEEEEIGDSAENVTFPKAMIPPQSTDKESSEIATNHATERAFPASGLDNETSDNEDNVMIPKADDKTDDSSKVDSNTLNYLNALISSDSLEANTTDLDFLDPYFGEVPIYNKQELFIKAFEHYSMMALKMPSTFLEPGGQILLPPFTTYTLPENAQYAIRYHKDDNGKYKFPPGTKLTSSDGKDIPISDDTEFENPLYSPKHFNMSYSIDTCPGCSGAPVYCDLTDGEYFLTHYGNKEKSNRSGVHYSFCNPYDFTTSTDISNIWEDQQ